jgi:hypothetical protein
MPISHDAGIDKMFVQMVDELADAAIHRWVKANVINHDEVRDEFAESNTTGVRAHWNAVSTSKCHDGEVVIDATNSA